MHGSLRKDVVVVGFVFGITNFLLDRIERDGKFWWASAQGRVTPEQAAEFAQIQGELAALEARRKQFMDSL